MTEGVPTKIPSSLQRPEDFFDTGLDCFRRACEKEERSLSRFFRLADFELELRFASETLIEPCTRAFRHVEIEGSASPDLSVCLWDGRSSKVPLPSPPGSDLTLGARGEVREFCNETYHTVYRMDSRVLSMLCHGRALAFSFVHDASLLPYWERGAPLLALLHPWLLSRGRQVVHGASVGSETGVVLLAGKGSSGKSNTALQALNQGMRYLGDDYCAVSLEPDPRVHSLYSTGKIEAHDLEHFPRFRPALANGERLSREKALFFLHDAFGECIDARRPLRAIVMPRVGSASSATRIERASPASTLMALAPSTVFQLPGAGKASFDFLSEVVRRVPGYAMELGGPREELPRRIRDLLEGL